jgi:hypothetical protein
MNNIDAVELWFRECPKCNNKILFSSQFSCEASVAVIPLCESCRAPRLPGGQKKKKIEYTKRVIISDGDDAFLAKCGDGYIRKCKGCGKQINHKGKQAEQNARTAIKNNKLCYSCQGKRRVKDNNPEFTFSGSCHLPETIEKMKEYRKFYWDDKKIRAVIQTYNTSSLDSCQCKKL